MWLVIIINYCPNLFSVLLRTFLKVALIVTSINTYLLFFEIGQTIINYFCFKIIIYCV